jgi:hypothetical protein
MYTAKRSFSNIAKMFDPINDKNGPESSKDLENVFDLRTHRCGRF